MEHELIDKIGHSSVMNAGSHRESSKFCPVTGLPILRKPEWTDMHFGKDYSFTLELVGDRILSAKATGYATSYDIEKAIEADKRIAAEAMPEGISYVRIEDWTDLKGTSREARKKYISYMQDNRRLQGLIFYGASSLFRLGIRLGKRLYKTGFNIESVNSYPEAIELATKILSNSNIAPIEFSPHITPRPSTVYNKNEAKHNIVADPDWQIQIQDFSFRCEIIKDNVLHVVSTGKYEEKYIDPCFSVLEKGAKSLNFVTRPCYLVMYLQETKGTKQKARMGYFRAANQIYKSYPFKMVILYGVNKFLKTALNVNISFLPMKIRVTDNLEDALALINKDNLKSKGPLPEYTEKCTDVTSSKTESTDQYVDELLQFIEKIDWDKNDIDQNSNIDPSHPFASVFDAIALVKWELDDLISERKRSEEDLKRAKELAERANMAKSDFLANMSHELRTPLNHIIGFTELVVDKKLGGLNETQEEYLTDVLRSGGHLLSLINDVLDLSKVEAGKQELEVSDVCIRELLENSMLMIKEKAGKHNIALKQSFVGIPNTIRADERKLKQVLYNLLSNAAKFTPDGGEIELSARLNETRDTGNKGAKEYMEISVRDTGIGLDQGNLDLVFDPFEQVENSLSRHFQGTGLGLALTKRFVELHDGRIWAESDGEGLGTAFRFTIPLNH